MNEPRFAKYVEGHISFNDMKAFVCEDPADMESFLKAIRDEQGLQVNAVMAPTDGLDKFKPAMDLHNLGSVYLALSTVSMEATNCKPFLCTCYKISSSKF